MFELRSESIITTQVHDKRYWLAFHRYYRVISISYTTWCRYSHSRSLRCMCIGVYKCVSPGVALLWWHWCGLRLRVVQRGSVLQHYHRLVPLLPRRGGYPKVLNILYSSSPSPWKSYTLSQLLYPRPVHSILPSLFQPFIALFTASNCFQQRPLALHNPTLQFFAALTNHGLLSSPFMVSRLALTLRFITSFKLSQDSLHQPLCGEVKTEDDAFLCM